MATNIEEAVTCTRCRAAMLCYAIGQGVHSS
jgi:hypothetical protein